MGKRLGKDVELYASDLSQAEWDVDICVTA
jgi:hypothetical protein